MLRIVTDRGSEYCGRAETHDYQLYLAITVLTKQYLPTNWLIDLSDYSLKFGAVTKLSSTVNLAVENPEFGNITVFNMQEFTLGFQ